MSRSLVSGILLAAGASRRFGGSSKALATIGGVAVVRRLADELSQSRLGEVLVVVGHQRQEVETQLQAVQPGVRTVVNDLYLDGQSGSVRTGLAAVSDRAVGALFVPVDQPFLSAAVVDRLIDAQAADPRRVIVPTVGDRRGAPVLVGRRWFDRWNGLRGDRGGRELLDACGNDLHTVAFADALPFRDFDTQEEFEQLRAAGTV